MLRLDDLQFAGLKIYQDTDGYAFTSDSVLLANFTKFLPNQKVVEFCAGSGVISILLTKKERPAVIHAFEIQPKVFKLLKKNIELNELTNVVAHNAPLEDAASILGSGFADVVVCNPPYLKPLAKTSAPTESDLSVYEYATNLESVVQAAKKVLKFGGKLFMVHRVDRMIDVLCCLRQNGLEPKKLNIIYPAEGLEPAVFLVMAASGGKKGLRVSKVTYASEANKA